MQLVHYKCRLGILCTGETTVFLARGVGQDKDTLFISPAYGPRDCPLEKVFCWFALANRSIKLQKLRLPKVDTTWWPSGIEDSSRDIVGIVKA